MSLKKRMFQANIIFLLSALLSQIAIIFVVSILFEDSFEEQLHSMGQTRIEEHAVLAAQEVREAKTEDIEELRQAVAQWGYQAAVISERKVTVGYEGKEMLELAEALWTEGGVNAEIGVFVYQKAMVVIKQEKNEKESLAAVYFPDDEVWDPLVKRFLFTFLTAVLMIVLDFAEVRFVLHVSQEILPEIPVDVEQVRRIFDNLLENSRKYAGVRPVIITISIDETKDHVILEWKDNGNGVPQEKLPLIFRRFYRCDEARKEKGSGICFYIVQYIMERHHGGVRAKNQDGLNI